MNLILIKCNYTQKLPMNQNINICSKYSNDLKAFIEYSNDVDDI